MIRDRRILLALTFVGTAVAGVLAVVAVLLAMDTPESVLDAAGPSAAGGPPERGVAHITVTPGDTVKTIAQQLVDEGVIDSGRRFETLVLLRGWENQLAAGDYDFEPGLSTSEIVERIHQGITSPLAVTIPEGLRLEEIAGRLEVAGVVSRAAFMRAVQQPANWFGTLAAQRPPGTSLNGYLFPGTYRFGLEASADQVVRSMLERMDAEFPAEQLAVIEAAGRTVHEVLTVASIVEREAVIPEERPLIAAVFWNRLTASIPLGADPTVQYALGNDPSSVAQFGYWKQALTEEDLMYESPFNTYINAGLPPGPIAAPGASAIDAATEPELTDFLYFVSRGDGSHAFASTFEEHQANVERYQGDGTDGQATDEGGEPEPQA